MLCRQKQPLLFRETRRINIIMPHAAAATYKTFITLCDVQCALMFDYKTFLHNHNQNETHSNIERL